MNFGFNFDGAYEQSTSKNLFDQPYDLNETDESNGELTRNELSKLLFLLENDLEQKEVLIKKLQSERANILLHEAKYGKLFLNDPFLALKRDSTITEEMLDERQVGNIYESQLSQLENLIQVQKKSHHKAKHVLANLEKRHQLALRELELEKDRKSRYAAQGDDVLALLEKERSKLSQQLQYQINEVKLAQDARAQVERNLQLEKEKHKTIVLHLCEERKQLWLKLHEATLRAEKMSAPGQEEIVDQMRKEIIYLRQERDALKTSNKSLTAENLSLKEKMKDQDSDLCILRRNLLGSKHNYEKSSGKLPLITGEQGSTIYANRVDIGTGIAQPSATIPRTRISNSNSFPSERSRLPRAPSSPARSSNSSSSRPQYSPTKKVPAMGLGTVRQRAANVPSTSIEPELQELDDAIRSMNIDLPNVAPSSPTKRSNSLTRGNSEPRKANFSVTTSSGLREARPVPPQMGSKIMPPSRSDTIRKSSVNGSQSMIVKKNGFPAFKPGK